MNGDLSLSQSLGGLRIANPDDDARVDAVPTIPELTPSVRPHLIPSHSSYTANSNARAASHPTSPQALSSELPSPSVYASPLHQGQAPYHSSSAQEQSTTSPRLNHRQSMPFVQQTQPQSSSHPSRPAERPSYLQQGRRPSSGVYDQQVLSSSPGNIPESSYQRVRADPTMSTEPNLIRSQSQAAAAAAMGFGQSPRSAAPPASWSRRGSQTNTRMAVQHPPRRSSRAPSTGEDSVYGSSLGPSVSELSNYSDATVLPNSGEEWQDKGAATTVQKTVNSEGKPTTRVVKKGVKDFNFGRTLGEGSYSTVLAATDRQTKREYAIKVLDKKHIIKEKKVKYVNIEKDTLNRLTDHPGIVRLYYTFQDERSLYFVLDLASGGELLGVLKKITSFDEDCSRFYGAQILDSIEYMHLRGIIHRDLKPENVLLDDQMHVKITDFGTAKILDLTGKSQFGTVSVSNDPLDGADTDRAVSFVGTAEYVSPELLTEKNACKASDLWAFGCIIYQLLAGRPPFKAANEYLTFQKIVNLEYTFPDGFPPVAKDLVQKLLVLDTAERLPISAIKAHPFFNGIEWGKGLWKQKPPRLRPYDPRAREINLTGMGMESGSSATPKHQQPGQSASTSIVPPTPKPTRPQHRIITEMAPPSQLDIDWSPVLTKNDERILRIGELNVFTAPAPISPTSRNGPNDIPIEAPSKFSRFFGAGANKKRPRLVMITSGQRLILAPSGGERKEAKMVIDLAGRDVTLKSQQDAKGYTVWCVTTREKCFTFEDPKANHGDPGSSMRSTQEWLDYVETAKQYVNAPSVSNSYSGDSMLNGLTSPLSRPHSGDAESSLNTDPSSAQSHRNMLRKDQDGDSMKGRKRFSKRHSKTGLAAVF